MYFNLENRTFFILPTFFTPKVLPKEVTQWWITWEINLFVSQVVTCWSADCLEGETLESHVYPVSTGWQIMTASRPPLTLFESIFNCRADRCDRFEKQKRPWSKKGDLQWRSQLYYRLQQLKYIRTVWFQKRVDFCDYPHTRINEFIWHSCYFERFV